VKAILAATLLVFAACAAPRTREEQRTVLTPNGAVQLLVRDRAGARVSDIEIERAGDAWSVSGAIRGAWLRTASRRTVRVEALGASGEHLSAGEVVAFCNDGAPRKSGLDEARFGLVLAEPARIARLELSIEAP
jgi:hypothetical protein